MKFPNAYSGVKKIFTGEILSIIGIALLIITAVLALVAAAAGIATETADAQTASALSAVAGGFLIGTVVFGAGCAVLMIISFILQIVGVSKASKDEPRFKTAFFLIMVGIISTSVSILTETASSFFPSLFGGNVLAMLEVFFSNLARIVTILVTYYIIEGITSLADRIGNEKISKQGKTILNLILLFLVLSLIAAITSDVFHHNGTNAIIASVLSLAAAIIEFVAYIIYLVFLGKAKKMLKEA